MNNKGKRIVSLYNWILSLEERQGSRGRRTDSATSVVHLEASSKGCTKIGMVRGDEYESKVSGKSLCHRLPRLDCVIPPVRL